jgi:hypothetical protein
LYRIKITVLSRKLFSFLPRFEEAASACHTAMATAVDELLKLEEASAPAMRGPTVACHLA